MSAILKALQKLEADSNSFQNWKINIRSAHRNTRKSRGILLFGILLSLVVLAYAGGLIRFRIPADKMLAVVSSAYRQYFSEPHENTVQPTTNHMPATQQHGDGSRTLSGSRVLAAKADLHQTRLSSPASPAKSVTEPGARPKPPTAFVPMPAQKPKPKDQNMRSSRLSVPHLIRRKPSHPAVQKASAKKTAAPPPALNDPSVTLQAIAWAEDPKERIAVINGQILHEGESVDGILIDGIKKDMVVVRKGIGSETETLVFRNK